MSTNKSRVLDLLEKATKPTNKQSAPDAYKEHLDEITKHLARLHTEMKSSKRKDTSNINWGHAEHLAHIKNKLKQISDEVFHEGEHDPKNN